MSGFPIRIAIRVDFSDGSQHEYEVRGPDTTEPPPGMVLWPAAVVSAAMREQITREQACTQALADAVFKLNEVRDWAERIRDLDVSDPVPDDAQEGGYRDAAKHVLRILDAP